MRGEAREKRPVEMYTSLITLSLSPSGSGALLEREGGQRKSERPSL